MRLPKKETVAIVALGVLAAMTSGKAGAQIVYGLVNEYYGRWDKSKNKTRSNINEKVFRVVLSRLRNDGLVAKNKKGLWGITRQGRNFAFLAREFLKKRESYAAPKNPEEKIVIVFDIPEKRRHERNGLRFELLALEFNQLQKSVWIGCGPLPADFITYLKDHDLFPCVHIFSVNKQGTISFTV